MFPIKLIYQDSPNRQIQIFCCFQSLRKTESLRAAMSHAQMNRIGWRELAHRQTYSSSDAYGERRDNEQAQACECRHGDTPTNWKLLGSLHRLNINL